MLYSGIAMAGHGRPGGRGIPEEFRFIGNANWLGLPFPMICDLRFRRSGGPAEMERSLGEEHIPIRREQGGVPLLGRSEHAHRDCDLHDIGFSCAAFSGLILMSRSILHRGRIRKHYLLQASPGFHPRGINPNGGSGRVTGRLHRYIDTPSLSSAFTLLRISPYARGLIYGVMLLVGKDPDRPSTEAGMMASLRAWTKSLARRNHDGS